MLARLAPEYFSISLTLLTNSKDGQTLTFFMSPLPSLTSQIRELLAKSSMNIYIKLSVELLELPMAD